MDSKVLETTIQKCFQCMLVNDYMEDQDKMIVTLRSIIYILDAQNHLTDAEKVNCIIYFCHEYNYGTNTPMSDSYILDTIVPIIQETKELDIPSAATILYMVQKK